MRVRLAWCSLAVLIVVVGCLPTSSRAPAGRAAESGVDRGGEADEPLVILAASDLQFALTEIVAQYAIETGRRPTVAFGSTGNLSQQIENGAPADLFFAADESFLLGLDRKGLLVENTRQPYGVGRITLTPARALTVEVTSLRDLLRPEVKTVAIANPEHAPYGLAAKQALQAAGAWDAVEPKLVLGENISQTFQFVQTGNADVGIVALSVVLGVPGTQYTLVDDALHQPLRQFAAVLIASKQRAEARAFLDYVNGVRGRPIMKKFGFTLPGES